MSRFGHYPVLGTAGEPPPMPWQPPGGPGGDGGAGREPGGPVRRPRHRRGVVITAACVVLVLAAALSTALALRTTPTAPHRPAAPHRAVSRTSAVAAAVDPGLVDVVATLGYQNAVSEGTGMLLTSSGEVLTNNHVIDGATSVKVTDVGNGRTYPATVVGYDQAGDVAVLQARGASGLRTVTSGTAARARVGEPVIALGNAGGKGGTPSIATGKITGLNESITATDEAEHTAERLTGLIRTNVPLQSGDSGGPLVTTAGAVIGMDTAASSAYELQAGPAEAFAIPIGRAAAVAGQIQAGRASGTVHVGATGFLGVQVGLYAVPLTSRTEAVVVGTMAGLPAARAGLAPGDVIVSINGRAVTSPSGIQALLEPYHPGDRVSIGWQDPSGGTHATTVVLAAGPAE
jgi:S1-C subfamily serine protease